MSEHPTVWLTDDRCLEEEYVAAVHAVAEAVRPRDPWRLTQQQFDAHRARVAGPACPCARVICRRLGTSWWSVRVVAVRGPAVDVADRFGDGRHRPYASEECVSAVMQAVEWAAPAPLTARRYRTWCASGAGRPWPRSLNRYGGFAALRAEAEQRLAGSSPPVASALRDMLAAARSPTLKAVVAATGDRSHPKTVAQLAAECALPVKAVAEQANRLLEAGVLDADVREGTWWYRRTDTVAGRRGAARREGGG